MINLIIFFCLIVALVILERHRSANLKTIRAHHAARINLRPPGERSAAKARLKAETQTDRLIIWGLWIAIAVCAVGILWQGLHWVLTSDSPAMREFWADLVLFLRKLFFAGFLFSLVCMFFLKRKSRRKWFAAGAAVCLGSVIFFGYAIPAGVGDASGRAGDTVTESKQEFKDHASYVLLSRYYEAGMESTTMATMAQSLHQVHVEYRKISDATFKESATAKLRDLDVRAQKLAEEAYARGGWKAIGKNKSARELFRRLAQVRDTLGDGDGSERAATMFARIARRADFDNRAKTWAQIKPDEAPADENEAFQP